MWKNADSMYLVWTAEEGMALDALENWSVMFFSDGLAEIAPPAMFDFVCRAIEIERVHGPPQDMDYYNNMATVCQNAGLSGAGNGLEYYQNLAAIMVEAQAAREKWS
jgi:hypothetical protein